MTTTASLIGARVRRIDAPSADLWAITLVAADIRGTLIVSLQPGATGIGWSEKRPHGMPATSFVQKCRKELEGGRLLALEEVGARCELSIGRADQKLRLAFDFAKQNVLLYAAEALLASAHKDRADAAHDSRSPARVDVVIALDELAERGRSLLSDRGEALLSFRKTALTRGLRNTRKKLSRKLDAIAGDAARASEAPALRARGQLLLSNLHAITRGATTVRVLDYNLDPPAEVDIPLDPAVNPREHAEALFKRAKRFENQLPDLLITILKDEQLLQLRLHARMLWAERTIVNCLTNFAGESSGAGGNPVPREGALQTQS